VARFLRLRNIVLVLGIATGLLLGLCYLCLFDQFINLLVASENQTQVRELLSPYGIPFAVVQPFLALSEVCDGLFYATKWFSYLRNVVIAGFFLVFVPLLLVGIFVFKNWFGIWISMSCFTVFRFLCLFPRILRARQSELQQLASATALVAASSEVRAERGAFNLQESQADRRPLLSSDAY
jgi:Na+-driven multidrug efflux pump